MITVQFPHQLTFCRFGVVVELEHMSSRYNLILFRGEEEHRSLDGGNGDRARPLEMEEEALDGGKEWENLCTTRREEEQDIEDG